MTTKDSERLYKKKIELLSCRAEMLGGSFYLLIFKQGGVLMAINPGLLRKKQLKDPKAEELLQEFEACYKYAQETDTVLTKNLWHVYLNIARQTMLNWQNSSMNLTLTDAEFNERLDMLKKIDDYIEASMAGELLSAKYPTGIIFYLKNAFKWADKHEPENTFNFKFDGFAPSKTTKKDDKKDVTVTSSAT